MALLYDFATPRSRHIRLDALSGGTKDDKGQAQTQPQTQIQSQTQRNSLNLPDETLDSLITQLDPPNVKHSLTIASQVRADAVMTLDPASCPMLAASVRDPSGLLPLDRTVAACTRRLESFTRYLPFLLTIRAQLRALAESDRNRIQSDAATVGSCAVKSSSSNAATNQHPNAVAWSSALLIGARPDAKGHVPIKSYEKMDMDQEVAHVLFTMGLSLYQRAATQAMEARQHERRLEDRSEVRGKSSNGGGSVSSGSSSGVNWGVFRSSGSSRGSSSRHDSPATTVERVKRHVRKWLNWGRSEGSDDSRAAYESESSGDEDEERDDSNSNKSEPTLSPPPEPKRMFNPLSYVPPAQTTNAEKKDTSSSSSSSSSSSNNSTPRPKTRSQARLSMRMLRRESATSLRTASGIFAFLSELLPELDVPSVSVGRLPDTHPALVAFFQNVCLVHSQELVVFSALEQMQQHRPRDPHAARFTSSRPVAPPPPSPSLIAKLVFGLVCQWTIVGSTLKKQSGAFYGALERGLREFIRIRTGMFVALRAMCVAAAIKSEDETKSNGPTNGAAHKNVHGSCVALWKHASTTLQTLQSNIENKPSSSTSSSWSPAADTSNPALVECKSFVSDLTSIATRIHELLHAENERIYFERVPKIQQLEDEHGHRYLDIDLDPSTGMIRGLSESEAKAMLDSADEPVQAFFPSKGLPFAKPSEIMALFVEDIPKQSVGQWLPMKE